MRRTLIALMLIGTLIIPAAATATGYEWRGHSPPFDYQFGNHIDTHQQSMLNEDGHLEGFLYITPGDDQDGNGVVDAKHGDCTSNPEGCEVGWVLHGIPYDAEYCGHNTGEHPTWAIDTEDLPRQRGFSHFHWENAHDNPDPHHTGLVVGEDYDGALLKLTAVQTFDFDHHHSFTVTPGIDFETHANVIDSCDDFEPSGGDHTDH